MTFNQNNIQKEKARKTYINWRKNLISETNFNISDQEATKKIDAVISIYIDQNSDEELIKIINSGNIFTLNSYVKEVLKDNIKKHSTYKTRKLSNSINYKNDATIKSTYQSHCRNCNNKISIGQYVTSTKFFDNNTKKIKTYWVHQNCHKFFGIREVIKKRKE
tara:strand:- start:1288 stop:1776 length:489 start_codon:yes stop_codon:yes gene_type:complete